MLMLLLRTGGGGASRNIFQLMYAVIIRVLNAFNFDLYFGLGINVNYLGFCVIIPILAIAISAVLRLFGDDNGKE